jgi:hypothetical protein
VALENVENALPLGGAELPIGVREFEQESAGRHAHIVRVDRCVLRDRPLNTVANKPAECVEHEVDQEEVFGPRTVVATEMMASRT